MLATCAFLKNKSFGTKCHAARNAMLQKPFSRHSRCRFRFLSASILRKMNSSKVNPHKDEPP